MDEQDSKTTIVKEVFPSELVSIAGDLFAGLILTVLILPFKSFILLIIIVPALLSLRGNISGPFIARTSRDLIIGEFNKRSIVENVLATYVLSITTALLIGLLSIGLSFFIFSIYILSVSMLLLIPIISIILTLSISIPCSILLNILAFRFGFNPNNVVNPIMTAVDDFFTVGCFFLTLLILGVP